MISLPLNSPCWAAAFESEGDTARFEKLIAPLATGLIHGPVAFILPDMAPATSG